MCCKEGKTDEPMDEESCAKYGQWVRGKQFNLLFQTSFREECVNSSY